MDSKSRALNKKSLVIAQPEMGKRDKSIYYEVYAISHIEVRFSAYDRYYPVI